MVKNTQRRSPVRASNACTVPGGSNLRCTRSGTRLPMITRSSNTTGGERWSNSSEETGRPWPSITETLPFSPKLSTARPVSPSMAYSRSRLLMKMRKSSPSRQYAIPR